MASQSDLLIVVDAVAEGMRKELARAERDLQRFSKQADREIAQVDSAFQELGKGIKGVLGAISVGAAVSGIVSLTRSALDNAGAIDDAAKKAGVSAERYQALAYAARLGGVETSTLDSALRNLNLRLAEGKIEAGNVDEALRMVADQMAAAADGSERVRIATEAFGKAGADLIPMLEGGADGLNKMTAEAAEFGQVMSDEAVTAAADFGDQIDRLGGMLKSQFQEGLIRALTEDTRDLGAVMSDPLVHKGIQVVGSLIGGTAAAAIDAARAIGGFAKSVQALSSGDFSGFSELMSSESERRKAERGAVDWSGSAGFLGDTSRGEGLKIELTKPAGITIPRATIKPVRIGGGRARAGGGSRSAIKEAAEDSADFAQVLREVESEFRDAQRVFDQTRTPLEKYRIEVGKLDKLLSGGLLDQDTYGRRLTQLMDELDGSLDGAAEGTDRLSDAARDLGLSFSSAFEDAVIEGRGLREVIQGLGQDIARIALRKTITEPFAGAVSSLFGSLAGSWFGGTDAASQMAAIRGAHPRMAGGGLVHGPGTGTSDSILAWLSRGEFVVDAETTAKNRSLLEALPRFRDGGFVGGGGSAGGGIVHRTEVYLENKSGTPLKMESERSERTADGREIIRVLVRSATEDLLRSGQLDSPMRARFGAAVQPISR